MLALIVAYSKNRVIGNGGKIPWKIKGEQKRFRELTLGNVVVMGRKTFEEIGKPLEGRTTVVVSKTCNFRGENLFTAKSLSEAIALSGNKDIFISGGAELYKEALPIVEKMYITEIECVLDGDTFFPEFNESEFVKEITEHHTAEIPYTYVTYTRK